MSITNKLRLAVCGVAVLAIATVIFSAYVIHSLGKDRQILTERQVPLFIEVDELNRDTFEELSLAASLFVTGRTGADNALVELTAISDAFTDKLEGLDRFGDSEFTGELLVRQENIQRQIQRLQTLSSNIDGARDAAVAALARAIDGIMPAQEFLLRDIENFSIAPETPGGAPAIARLRRLVSVDSDVRAIIEALDELRQTSEKGRVEQIKYLMLVRLRDITFALTRLEDRELRSALARPVTSLRRGILDGTTLGAKEEEAGLNQLFLDTTSNLVEALNEQRSATVDLVNTQRLEIAESSRVLNVRTQLFNTVLVLLAIVATLLSVSILYFIIERQVAKRLAIVDSNLRNITAGNLAPSRDIAGSDEIARINHAVDSLRLNTLVRERLEKELRDKTALAEASAAAKSNFLSMMSHEVRTPLNAIMGLFELIEGADIPERQKRRAVNGRLAAEGLFELLSKVLDAARLEEEQVPIDRSQVETGELQDFLSGTLEGALAKHSKTDTVTASVEMAPDTPRTVLTDYARVKQISVNLIDNAVRFTDSGAIKISLAPGVTPQPSLALTVRDSGMGIPSDQFKRIFESFQQVDGTITRRQGGSGLGLAISKNLAILLGGDLLVKSAVGEGSEFTLILPVKPVSNTKGMQS
ncbi:sensor histidine kinase [Poseidonocella pacifica]|uniref:sensor histidine kinase n=1 Tax=Poseidonocella pacifica TaxID=871651 RepID=UPI000B86D539|nr:ATP-binding protein [Poseidonocella pacifica]